MKINIEALAYKKIMHWVHKCPFEVSGFGTVVYDKDTHTATIKDAFLVKQEGGAAHTDIDAEALAMAEYKAFKAGGEMRFWWHSHVNMAVFWSGTDMDTIKELGGNGWMISTVFNKKEETRTALSYRASTDLGVFTEVQDDLDLTIIEESIDTTAWDAEYDSLVTRKIYTPIMGGYVWDATTQTYKSQGASLLNATSSEVNPYELRQQENARLGLVYNDKEEMARDARFVKMSLKEFKKIVNHGTIEERENLVALIDVAYYENYNNQDWSGRC